MEFIKKLQQAIESHSSLLCVGLDPDPARMPVADIFEFNRAIIDATSDLVCAYKPNIAFYEAMGIEGLRALERTIAHVPSDIPVIGDAKRGDIGNTARAYASAVFEVLGFDAVTVNPYMGQDSLEPFLAYADRGIFILCRTSNPGGADFQGLLCQEGGGLTPLFEIVAKRAEEWNDRGNVGLVVGATFPEELKRVRELCPEMPILIPGVGPQGGDLELAVRYGMNSNREGAIISSSRRVIYASEGDDFASAARRAAQALRDNINRFRR